MTPDFLPPSPTQLDCKYFSPSDQNSPGICWCLWCSSCTSPVVLTAGLCQHSPWTGLHTAEVYPCCPSNKTTQAAPQEPSSHPWQSSSGRLLIHAAPSGRTCPPGLPSKGTDLHQQPSSEHWLGPAQKSTCSPLPQILRVTSTNYIIL